MKFSRITGIFGQNAFDNIQNAAGSPSDKQRASHIANWPVIGGERARQFHIAQACSISSTGPATGRFSRAHHLEEIKPICQYWSIWAADKAFRLCCCIHHHTSPCFFLTWSFRSKQYLALSVLTILF